MKLEIIVINKAEVVFDSKDIEKLYNISIEILIYLVECHLLMSSVKVALPIMMLQQ